jgi:ABC-2 type transport system ATP-binding protein
VEARGIATGEERLGELAAPAQLEPTAALKLRAVSKRWGDLHVLDDVDLEIRRGERAWIGGRNGIGKTTLLRIAAGMILPDAGDVELDGLHAERDRRAFHARLGFLAAGNTALYARLSVYDNLAFWAGIAFIPRKRRVEAIEAAIARFDIQELARRRADRLSMGQRQRVRLAGTFLHHPTVVLLDEPETSLDDEGLALIAETLDDHVSRGGAALICSPTRERLGVPVDRGYVLDSGKVRAE